VGAGIVTGNIGPKGMSPTTRIVLFNFWEYLAFVANSLVFLLIGLEVNIPQIIDFLGPIAVAVFAVIVSRILVVYGFTWLVNRRRRKVSLAYQHVLFWGGLRGAISLALALSIPTSFADRELLRVMAFGVVLFTLLVQGTTMQLLLHRLGLVHREEIKLEYERRHARLMAARAARDRLQRLYQDGLISTPSWEQLMTDIDQQIEAARAAQRELLQAQPALQRAMLVTLVNDGVISQQVYEELVTEVDAALEGEPEVEEEETPPHVVA
jgi:CPA1 family monovalent cation:H+ antiporter